LKIFSKQNFSSYLRVVEVRMLRMNAYRIN